MEIFVSSLLAALAGLLTIFVAIFFIEVVAALVLPHRNLIPRKGTNPRGRVAVLLPAHNESSGLLSTIEDVQRQLLPGDRLLVVADNCTDDTARIASTAGAEVAERHDPAKRGKGYALEFGVKELSSAPPEILIVIDADCRLAENTIERLAIACTTARRPVQALYLMTAPEDSQINHQVAEFAWRVKNWLRPLGLSALGLPCQLMGTGMAFPWPVIGHADLGHGSIVEDLSLGLDLAAAGHPPMLCPSAIVTSQFASSVVGTATQRERWEQGHIKSIFTLVPTLIRSALACHDWNLLALTLDLVVPPLSLLVLLILGLLLIAGTAGFFGLSYTGFVISVVNVLAFTLAIVLAWLKFGREVLPLKALLLVGPYAVGKLGLYFRILSKRTGSQWIRTDRAKSD